MRWPCANCSAAGRRPSSRIGSPGCGSLGSVIVTGPGASDDSQRSDFEGVGDPLDLYLVGTDDAGKTGCSEQWSPPQEPVSLNPQRVLPQAVPAVDLVTRELHAQTLDTAFRKCP